MNNKPDRDKGQACPLQNLHWIGPSDTVTTVVAEFSYTSEDSSKRSEMCTVCWTQQYVHYSQIQSYWTFRETYSECRQSQKFTFEDQIDREGVRFRSAEETEHFQKHVSNHDVSTLPIYRAVVKNIDCSFMVYIPRKLKKVGMRISIRWYFGTFLNKVRSLIHLDSLLSKFKEFAKSYDQ